MAQYPFGAVGQFAVGSVPTFGASTDLPIPSASSVSAAPVGNIVVGITLDIPASSSVSAAPIPPIAVGITLDIPASSSVSAAPIPEIVQSSNIIAPSSSSVSATPIPAIAAGASIIVNTEVTMIWRIGPVGFGAVGQYAVGDGPSITHVAFRSPLALSNASSPMIGAGASAVIGATASNTNAPVNEIDARRRKLRILAIAS